ncbi:hypothetical protein B4135_1077 [Caldibacillus debilis]|uniref:Uncharacterized protein n=1 Tax=Caldibacillus debilis TaxID=301148 RepID=A0A150MEN7_9BACI|nr:hypothetical protein B4135_1077 [Caldibacillus debilis]
MAFGKGPKESVPAQSPLGRNTVTRGKNRSRMDPGCRILWEGTPGSFLLIITARQIFAPAQDRKYWRWVSLSNVGEGQ